ncbi:hypothetical protein Tco_1422363 [Tanacetum coccineum]
MSHILHRLLILKKIIKESNKKILKKTSLQDGRVDIQTKNAGYGGNGNRNAGRQNKNQAFARNVNDESHYARDCQKPRVHDAKYFREKMLLAMKDEVGSNLNAEENAFMLDNSFRDETLEELTATVIMMAQIQPVDDNVVTEPTYDAKAVSEVYASHKAHEQVNHVKRKTIIHTSDDDQIDSNIIFDDPYVENNGGTSEHDSNDHDEYHNIRILAYNVQKEAEKDAKESRLKMRNKIVQLNYGKLNALYEKFVPQKEPFVEQTYIPFPTTSNECSKSNEFMLDLQIPKMPKESKLLKMFEKKGLAIGDLRNQINVTFLEDIHRRWMSDNQNSLREFYKTDVIPMSVSLSKTLKELQQELIEEKNELLKTEIEKSLSDSRDIQDNLLKRIKILENDFISDAQLKALILELQTTTSKEKWLMTSLGTQDCQRE